MNIKITAVHFDADKKLIDFAQKKVEKMAQFYDGIVGVEVFFRLENTKELENKISEIRIEIPGNDLFAKKQCKTFEEAVDQAIDALKSQMTKFKEKQRGA
jgi:putative sigma-54 modulation protein